MYKLHARQRPGKIILRMGRPCKGDTDPVQPLQGCHRLAAIQTVGILVRNCRLGFFRPSRARRCCFPWPRVRSRSPGAILSRPCRGGAPASPMAPEGPKRHSRGVSNANPRDEDPNKQCALEGRQREGVRVSCAPDSVSESQRGWQVGPPRRGGHVRAPAEHAHWRPNGHALRISSTSAVSTSIT